MEGLAKALIGVGIITLIVGVLLLGATRLNLPVGRLPGDISIQRGRTSFFFPIVTCLVVSCLMTFILWVLQNLKK